jgi:LysM repeat protein
MNRNRQYHLILLALFVLLSLVSVLPASAQCNIPSGWQPYTVVRGDNLYRIALRFRTTVAALQSGNCLGSTRITAGQTLYVPPGSALPAPVPDNTVAWRTTPATFQQYERGFMIWRADTSDIWVYISGSRNRLNVHPAVEYSPLPSNTSTAPGGLVQPIMGFGKVWSNLNNYRQSLGWATSSERSFTLRFGILNHQMVEFSLPDGSAVVRHSDGFWSSAALSGASVIIQTPASGANLAAGANFNVSGQAVGVFEASFVLELRAMPSGTVLASQIITYAAPDFSTLAPWQTTLNPGAYVGAAELRAVYARPSDGAQIVLAAVPVIFR